MPLFRKRKSANTNRLFHGGTNGKIIQTVDIGAGQGKYLSEQKEKYPHRRYVAVDPRYSPYYKGISRQLINEKKLIEQHNIDTFQGGIKEFINAMKEKKEKTRHFNFHMPLLTKELEKEMKYFFENLESVLLPNGKVFITSENPYSIKALEKIAAKNGFKIRRRKSLQEFVKQGKLIIPKGILRSESMTYYNSKVSPSREFIKTEITFGLKKARENNKKKKRVLQKGI